MYSDYSYRREIVRDKPVLYWPLDNATIQTDFLPTSTPFTASVGTGNGNVLVPGPFKNTNALRLDGSGNGSFSIPFANAGRLRGTNFTLSIWTRYDYYTQNPTIVRNSNAAGTNGWYLFNFTNVNNWYQLVAAQLDSVGSFVSATQNYWDNVIVTTSLSSPNIMTMWFNGVKTVYDTPSVRNDNSDGDFMVGTNWCGALAHLALYDYALSPRRIQTQYQTAKKLLQVPGQS